MAVRSDGIQTQKRILQVCVRLFSENGYHQTTMAQILREAQVSSVGFRIFSTAREYSLAQGNPLCKLPMI